MSQLGDKDKLKISPPRRLMGEQSTSMADNILYFQDVELTGAIAGTTSSGTIATSLSTISAIIPTGICYALTTDFVLTPNDEVSFNGIDIASTATAEAITAANGIKQFKKLTIAPKIAQSDGDKTIFRLEGTKD